MYALFLELEGLRQLSRLTPDVGRELLNSVGATVLPLGGVIAQHEGNHLLVLFPRSGEEDHYQVLDAGFQLLAGLKPWHQELIGSTLVAEYVEDELDTGFRRLRKMVNRLPHDAGIWIGTTAERILDGTVAMRRDRGFALIDAPTQSESRGPVDCHTFLRSDEAVIEALDAMEPWIVGDAPPAMLLFRSRDRRHARAVAEHVAGDLCGTAAEPRWISLYPSEREDAAVAPIANSVFPGESLNAFLHSYEAALRDRCVVVLDGVRNAPATPGVFDHLETDVLSSFGLAVLARYRELRSQLIPPVMVLENIDHFSVESVRLIRRVYDRLEPEVRPFLLATSAHATVPVAFADLLMQVIALQRPTAATIAAAADRMLSDTAKRSVRIADSLRRSGGMFSRLYHHFVCVHDALNHSAAHRTPIAPAPENTGGNSPDTDEDTPAELSATLDLVDRLHQDEREILAVACLVGGRVGAALAGEIAHALSFDPLRVRQVARRLASLGLVRDAGSLFVENGSLRDAVLQSVEGDTRRIRSAVARTLLSMVETDQIHLTRSLISVVSSTGEDWLPAFRAFLRHALDARRFDRVLPIFGSAADVRGATDRPDLFDDLLAFAQLRMALLAGDETSADQRYVEYSEGPRTPAPFDRSVAADGALELARYAAAKGDFPRARSMCKQAIMGYQDADDSAGVGRANLEFGSLLLGREQIGDARDYFLMTRPPSGSGRYGYDEVRGVLSEIVCLFVSGHLTRVRGHVQMIRNHAHGLGMRDVELLLDLVEGRVAFELGMYDEATSHLEQGLCSARIYDNAAAAAVFRAWIARCLVYRDDPRTALCALEEMDTRGEVRLFRAEALYRMDMPREAGAQLTDQEPDGRTVFRSPETIDWSDGFAPLENRAFGVSAGESVLRNQATSLGAYLTAVNGEVDDAIEQMHRLTRQEKISTNDPYNRLYYFLYSEILPRSKSPDREDYLTILGKSVKYMQERNSRLDEYRDKTSFLSRNYWNRLLLEEARTHNLI
ncbi:MAG: hypothetical protein EA403_07945 [Spirochaetaceae bacterium]|nr:MAG: hypothetical protein EA403_07945 [Spirochaetaceae bacterium]